MESTQLVFAILTFLAALGALLVGMRHLRQTRNFQERERKRRLVKEVEDWAKEVITFMDEYKRDGERSDPATALYSRQGRWDILKTTRANMTQRVQNIDKELGRKVESAVIAFDTVGNNIGRGLMSNIYNDLERCKRSCEELLQSARSLRSE